jgi:hypothetical protein
MRIAFLADDDDVNAYYRAYGPLGTLAQRGHEVRSLWVRGGWPAVERVRGIDLLHIHRFSDEEVVLLAREAKSGGAAVVWDNDDDIGAVPRRLASHRQFRGLAWERRLAGMRRIFELADLVTTPSHGLAQRLRDQGAPRTQVLENYVPREFLDPPRRPHAGVSVGWMAAGEHRIDAEELGVRSILGALLQARPDVQVTTIGIGINLALRSERYRHVQSVNFKQLTRHLAEFDIGIAPIADVDFNRARSNVKLKEYAAAGCCWLASPIGPYTGMGERQGGRLVPDDRWEEELLRLVDGERERRKLQKRAAKWAKGETVDGNGKRWEAAFKQVVADARSR